MVIGHQKQWQFLKKSVEIGKIAHAFLFFGQAQLGKKTLALEFIKLLNCQNDSLAKKPCQVCRSCQDIERRQHPNLLIVEPQNKEIQISQIRELINKLTLKPFTSSFKTAILDQAHLMNQESQTALLKTLEEPKGDTVLILITEYPEALFSTILSRVQKIKFFPVERKEIESFLNKKGFPPDKIRLISDISFGRPGIAINFLSNPEKLESEKQKLVDLMKITDPHSDLISRFQYVKKISQKSSDSAQNTSQNLKETLDGWLRYFREVLLIGAGATPDFDNSPELQMLSKRYSLPKLRKIIQTLQNIIFFLSTTNINNRLALEILMLEL